MEQGQFEQSSRSLMHNRFDNKYSLARLKKEVDQELFVRKGRGEWSQLLIRKSLCYKDRATDTRTSTALQGMASFLT
ncbi:hypothetical protein OH492_19985 [Vibrio chagasii]|nr:hypothetical protein [Vibrio chagasii]